jgi:NRPS condensation-like uncharacterized protein
MRRKTSSLERYMLFFGRQYPLNFAFLMRIDKAFDEARARTVLESLAKRHPALFAHQEYTEGKQMDMVSEEPAPVLLSHDTAAESASLSREAFMLSHMSRKFDPFTGPLFSLDWRKAGQGTELCFVFQHGVADGIAATWIIHDFLRLYSGVTPSLPACAEMPVLYDVLLDEVRDELLTRPEPDWKKEEPPAPEPFDIPPYTVPDFYLRLFTLESDGTSRLAAMAREAGLTVNSYLGALILKAAADIFGPDEGYERTIQCPVDFRQYLKEDYRTLAGTYNGIVKVKVDCTLPVEEMALRIRDGIRESRAGMKDVEEYFHFRDSFDDVPDPESLMMSFGPDPIDYDFSFSNLGRTIVTASYNDLDVREFFGPVFTAVNGETVIGLNTTNGVLRMSLIFDKSIEKADKFRALGDKIEELFAEIVQQIS